MTDAPIDPLYAPDEPTPKPRPPVQFTASAPVTVQIDHAACDGAVAPPGGLPLHSPAKPDLQHEAEQLIRREFSRRQARKHLLAMGFTRPEADAALTLALAPRRARRWRQMSGRLLRVVVTASIATGIVWWRPGPDHGLHALAVRFGFAIGWVWIVLGTLAMLRWFWRHHGVVVLLIALVRPIGTIRRIVMDTDGEDLAEIELPFFAVVFGVGLVALLHHLGPGPGTVIYVDPR